MPDQQAKTFFFLCESVDKASVQLTVCCQVGMLETKHLSSLSFNCFSKHFSTRRISPRTEHGPFRAARDFLMHCAFKKNGQLRGGNGEYRCIAMAAFQHICIHLLEPTFWAGFNSPLTHAHVDRRAFKNCLWLDWGQLSC